MNPLDFLLHLLGFAAPAFAVAAVVTLAGPWLLPRGAQRPRWTVMFALNFIAGLVVLAAGLAWFGRDGKMATYAALVLAVASCQWLAGRGWRG